MAEISAYGKAFSMSKRKRIDAVGHLLNISWSIICFAPVVMYWVEFGVNEWLFVFVFLSIVTMCMPKRILCMLRIHDSKKYYENRGVKIFRKFVQEGNYSWATKTRTRRIANILQAKQYSEKTDMYERFHWCCMVFFLFSGIHCFIHGQVTYGILTEAANAIYNIPAILLQQYNRLRIEGLINREKKY